MRLSHIVCLQAPLNLREFMALYKFYFDWLIDHINNKKWHSGLISPSWHNDNSWPLSSTQWQKETNHTVKQHRWLALKSPVLKKLKTLKCESAKSVYSSWQLCVNCSDLLQAIQVLFNVVVVIVIAQQLFSYHQLSRLRKSGLSHRYCTVICIKWVSLAVEQMFYGVWCHSKHWDKHLICQWRYGPCKTSRANSNQNTTGQVWYGLIEAADFWVIRYRSQPSQLQVSQTLSRPH